MGASPMKLGLDLSGGVHFLLEVNTEQAVAKRMETMVREVRSAMREEKLRYKSVKLVDKKTIVSIFNSEEDRDSGNSILRKNFREVSRQLSGENGLFVIRSELLESSIREIEDYALNQNLTTLRNRVNELGVSEPIVQRQGRNRVVVELPGVQDTAEAKRIIGKTANLEFRLEAAQGALSREKFEFSDPARLPRDAYLERSIVITGDHVSDAKSEFDENGMPQVGISLDSDGGARMHRASRKNIGRRLGVLFIEYKTRMKDGVDENGEQVQVPERYVEKKIISLATIQSALGVSFRITGLDSPREASELALLLRAGALAAPMYFVEERTIGPSLGAENVALGIKSVTIGMVLVLSFMLVYYKVFGIFANIALSLNLVILVAAMSILGATLTLPGIAGIVLTVGMAVDANVLIFSRIKEELANGLPPQSAIKAGYDRAFVSIIDANLTTLIVAVILYAIGSGPVQGFAVTLSIGILTSMFTAIVGTRALVNLVFGGRNINKVWI
jgi:preprotein translocase subunit SecD